MDDQDVVITDATGTEHVFPPGFDRSRAAAIVRARGLSTVSSEAPAAPSRPTIRPVAPAGADESVGEAQWRGLKEGVAGGAKGFVEGMVQSPASFAKGIAALLTTNPVATVQEAVQAILRLPDALSAAGADPEAWGKSVGEFTGQTMIGLAGPKVLRAGARGVAAGAGAVADAAGAVADSPLAAKVVPKVVKYGTTAAGATAGSALGPGGTVVGGIIGREIGGNLGEAVAARMSGQTATATAAAQTAADIIKSGAPLSPSRFAELLQQVPKTARPALLAARQAAVAAAPEAETPLEVTQRLRAANQAATPPAAPQTPPAAAQGGININMTEPNVVGGPEGGVTPEKVPDAAPPVKVSRPVAMKMALDTFEAVKETPQPAEVANMANLIQRGATPEQALKVVLDNRAPVSPAADLARRLGSPSDAAMKAALRKKALSGTKSLMGVYGGQE